ncbi:MAG TPA: redoxin domain-containing protein [Anaeromyxobacteraceae bacterium]|nr:redoxin domain-containing protein [Anaeromyxobacteraceae bacterium]
MPLAPGSFLPAATVQDLGGGEVPLSGLGTGPALLFFHRADCPATVVAAKVLPRFAGVPGLVVAAISQDGAEETREFAAASGWTSGVTVLRDPDPWPASEACGMRATPTWFLVTPGGRVEMAAEGWSRDDANALAAAAGRLTGSAPLVVAQPNGPEPPLRPG